MFFRIKDSSYSIDIETEEKYVLVDGLSGKGKTAFVQFIEDIIDNNILGVVEADRNFMVIRDKDNLDKIPSVINEFGSTIFIVDEVLAEKTLHAIQDTDLYCIAITRRVYSNIKMSYKSLYEVERSEDGVTRFKPKYLIESCCKSRPDVVITEDTRGGAELVESLNIQGCEIDPAGGNTNIKRYMKKHRFIERLLVICDAGGIAACIYDIMSWTERRKERGLVTNFLMPECFEQVLLCSAFIGWDKNIYKYFDIKYNNTEDFCEAKIEELSYGKPYFYKHKQQGSLSKCWLINCDKCDTKCEYALQGDKKRLVLENGPLEDLLHFCEGRVEDAMDDMQNLLEDLQRQLSST